MTTDVSTDALQDLPPDPAREFSHDEAIEALAAEVADLPADFSADRHTAGALTRLRGRWKTSQTPVVISGEVSRGKSELINALVGGRLLPSHFKACSAVWARIGHGEAFEASARIRTPDGVQRRRLPREELPDYLTVEGQSRMTGRHGKAAQVEAVSVSLPAPLLETGIELLDTPGVNGLTSSHLRAALAGLEQADAVVFVTKPGEPISASERRFLAEAVARVEVCLIVGTHRDQVHDADAALAEDTALLTDVGEWTALLGDPQRAAELAERFTHVPAISVSATNRLAALEGPPGPERVALERASNVGALEDVLRTRVVDRIARVHRENLLHLCGLYAADVAAVATLRASLLRDDDQARAALAEQERVLRAWEEHGGDHWRVEFQNTCDAAAAEFGPTAEARSAELLALRRRLPDLGRDALGETVQSVADTPQEVLVDLLGRARTAIETATRQVRVRMSHDGLDGPLTSLSQAREVQARVVMPERTELSPDLSDLRNTLGGGILGAGAVNLGAAALMKAGLLAAGAAVPIFWPFIVGGAAFGGFAFWKRKKQRGVAQAQELIDTVRGHLAKDVVPQARDAFAEAAHVVCDEVVAALEDQRRNVEQSRRVLADRDGLASDPGAREVRIAELDALAARASGLRDRAASLRGQL